MSKLTAYDVYQYATQCPAWKGKYVLMTCIAFAESGGDTEAGEPGHDYNPCCVGLWQINCAAHGVSRSSMCNPIANVNEACKVFASQGLDAWESYTNGSYKNHVSQVKKELEHAGVDEHDESLLEPFGGAHSPGALEGAYSTAKKGVEGTLSGINEVGHLFSLLEKSSTWTRVGKVALGATFLIVAAVELTKGDASSAVRKIPSPRL